MASSARVARQVAVGEQSWTRLSEMPDASAELSVSARTLADTPAGSIFPPPLTGSRCQLGWPGGRSRAGERRQHSIWRWNLYSRRCWLFSEHRTGRGRLAGIFAP